MKRRECVSIMQDLLLYFSLKYKGDFNKIYEALLKKEAVNVFEKDMLKKRLEISGCNYTTLVSDNYPMALKLINCSPFVLYYYGDISLLDEKTISLIGTRQPSPLGEETTKNITQELVNNNFVMIAGLEKGTGAFIHQEGWNNNGRTIAVMHGGIENNPIKENSELYNHLKNEQLIISEYPGYVEPTLQQLGLRSRLITAFSDALVIIETREEQECLSAQYYAFEQGKEVFCIPSDFGCEISGNIHALESGAKIYTGIESLYKEDLYLEEECEDGLEM